jgi:hypothetical protein
VRPVGPYKKGFYEFQYSTSRTEDQASTRILNFGIRVVDHEQTLVHIKRRELGGNRLNDPGTPRQNWLRKSIQNVPFQSYGLYQLLHSQVKRVKSHILLVPTTRDYPCGKNYQRARFVTYYLLSRKRTIWSREVENPDSNCCSKARGFSVVSPWDGSKMI